MKSKEKKASGSKKQKTQLEKVAPKTKEVVAPIAASVPVVELQAELSPSNSALLYVGFGVFVIFAVNALFTIGYTLTLGERIAPHTSIAQVSVGGLSLATAQKTLESATQKFADQKMQASYGDQALAFSPQEVGAVAVPRIALDQAWRIGRSANLLVDVADQWRSLFGAETIPLPHDIDTQTFETFYDGSIGKLGTAPVNATLAINKDSSVTLQPAQDGNLPDKTIVKAAIIDRLAHLSTDTITIGNVTTPAAIQSFDLAEAAKQIPTILAENFTLSYNGQQWTLTKKQMQKWLQIHAVEVQNIANFENQEDIALTSANELVYLNDQGTVETSLLLTQSDDSDYPLFNQTVLEAITTQRTPKTVEEKTLAAFGVYHNQELHPPVVPTLVLSRNAITASLDSIAKDLTVPGQNARLSFNAGKLSIIEPSKAGRKLNIDDAAAKIREAVLAGTDRRVALTVDVQEADISENNLDKLGITSLIATGTSNFVGSPKNRIHNIRTGAAKFNGVLIKPGEEFSFLKVLGPVDASTGYLPELVIKDKKTIPDFGGGMCQVSTTAFRAAVAAGLSITERRNHSYAVQYYAPQGTDATVFIPSPDLKFVNNTPGYILIQTHIDGNILTYDFYGTPDGRTVKTVGPKIYDRKSDGSMKATWTQIVTDKSGKEIINKTFNSVYKPPALFH